MDPLAERLRHERERQGRTLRELAAETKIREPFLEALEMGRYNVLPAVYVRSFIRTAGAALHISPKEIAALMNEVFDPDDDDTSTHLPPSQPPLVKTPQRSPVASVKAAAMSSPLGGLLAGRASSLRSPLVMAMGIIALIAIGVLVWALFLRSSDTGAQAMPASADTVLDVDGTQLPGGGGPSSGAIAETDSMVLTARARDTAWLNITSDEKRTQQVVVLPGGDYRWSAMQKFVLSISNAGAVTFSRNGQELKPFGKSGEAVRSITITRKEVRSSSSVVRVPPKPVPVAPRPIITPAPRQRVDPNKRTKPEPLPRR